MITRDELRAEKALQGLDFPASKAELIEYANERSATPKTLQALEALPDWQYGNKDDVVIRTILDNLGKRLEGSEVADLAAQLPDGFAPFFEE